MIKIMVVDDHPLVRNGLAAIISDEKNMKVCCEAVDAAEMFQKLNDCKDVDILILDISMPGISGFDALPKLKMRFPQIQIIMLSALSEEIYAAQCLSAGAVGFLSKESAPEELIKAIHKVSAGGMYVSPEFAEKMAFNYLGNIQKLPHEDLSWREFQIFLSIGSGKKAGQIADEMNLSVKTISSYRARIMDKMNLKSNAEIIRYCLDRNLL